MKLDFEHHAAGDRTALRISRRGLRMDETASPDEPLSSWPARHDGQRAIFIRERYDAPPERVFEAWLDPGIAGRWLFATASQPMAHVDIDARVGGSFRFADRRGAAILAFTGRYVEIVPGRRLAFTLCTPRRPVASLVAVTIAPRGTGCTLSLIHEQLSGDEAPYFEDRWTGILYGLGATLDSLPQPSTLVRSPR
jgi:uncharacterized protein YndB with AHSA1/START domain